MTAPTKPAKPNRSERPWRETESYPYSDGVGNFLYELIRLERGKGRTREKKLVAQRPSAVRMVGTTDPNHSISKGGVVIGLKAGKYVRDLKTERVTGKSTWRRAGTDSPEHGEEWIFAECPLVPYRLPKLLQSPTVYLVEGEKDVATLEAWGLVGSCNPFGAKRSDLYARWLEYFRGRHVVIVPDNDGAGRKHAWAVAKILMDVAASVRIVELRGLPEKGDVTDWRDAGGTLRKFNRLAGVAKPLTSLRLSKLRERWGLADSEARHDTITESSEWPDPVMIRSELPMVEAFSDDLLPAAFGPFVRDLTERMQVPMDFPAVAMVNCVAGAINRRASIQPKKNDAGWIEISNLWGAIVAPPGLMKSPVIQMVTRSAIAIQDEWRKEWEVAMERYAQDLERYNLHIDAWKSHYKNCLKNNKPPPRRPENEPEQPKLRRLVVNDATFEALHETMSANPAGVLLIRDEIVGWLAGLDRAGHETERAFCLEAWNGKNSYTVDRIGRGMIHVPACCMALMGGIQPGRLRSYLVDALKDGPANDGLIQRFQLIVWPDTTPGWKYVDRPPNPALERRVARVFRRLVELDAKTPARFQFAPDAQDLFVEWLESLEAKIRRDELHPALISHLSKYRKLMPSLALVFELVDRTSSEGFDGSSLTASENFVHLAPTRQSMAWCKYLESHARRLYSCVVTPQVSLAGELAEKIKQRKVGADGFFSCRDVYLKGWSRLDTPDAVRTALEVLEDAEWVREARGESGPSGGRPSDRYVVNPKVWK